MRTSLGRMTRLAVLLSTLAIGVGTLAACGSSDAPEQAAAGDGAFPVTIEHKYGSTTIPAAPQRVVSLGYYDQEPLLALGVVPVAIREFEGGQPFATWPWSRDRLGSAQPQVLPVGEVSVESIAALQPDLIVGLSGGLNPQQYQTYSQIAPTIAQPAGVIDYGLPWQDSTRTVGKAVGKSAEADRVVAELETRVRDTAARFPQLAGKKIAVVRPSTDASVGYFVTGPQDLRSRIFAGLGMTGVPEFDQAAGTNFFGQFSDERLGLLDEADVVVLYASSAEEANRFRSKPGFATLRVAREGKVLTFDPEVAAALSFSSVLSIPVVLDRAVPQVAQAVA